MKTYASHFLALQLSVGSLALAGQDHVWVIGGGPDILNAQVQIERNVTWALHTIKALPGQRTIRTYFNDGDDPGPDIHEWTPPPDSAADLQPLARVFDSYWYNGLRYRNHRIPDVAGSTEADQLVEALGLQVRALAPDDRVWLFFIGHGTYSEDLDNRIELWNGTRLNVEEMKALLDGVPRQTRLRFLFTQCYAGAFAELAVPERNRCGFLAEAADRQSEGCSAAIEQRDFEDYSTYFFAALSGRPRDGAGLNGRPDWDADGEVTPLEAHFHVLATAYSSDIPRTTSEELLMQWQPWYLELLLPLVGDAENEYTELARSLADLAGVTPGSAGEKEIEKRRADLEAAWERLVQDYEALRVEIASLQERIRVPVLRRWPQAGSPYTRNYKRFLEQDVADVQAFIQGHRDYPELRDSQQKLWQLELQVLDIQRAHTRLAKIVHLRRLARLKAALETFGPEELLQRYRNLRECESAPF